MGLARFTMTAIPSVAMTVEADAAFDFAVLERAARHADVAGAVNGHLNAGAGVAHLDFDLVLGLTAA